MKNILSSLLLLQLIFGCGGPQNADENNQVSLVREHEEITNDEVERTIDSDGDMVSDLRERELNRSPTIADLPRVRLVKGNNTRISFAIAGVGDEISQISLVDSGVASSASILRKRVANGLFLHLTGQVQKNISDDEYSYLALWQDDEYLQFENRYSDLKTNEHFIEKSGRIDMDLSLVVDGGNGIAEVSDLFIETTFLDRHSPVGEFKISRLMANEVDSFEFKGHREGKRLSFKLENLSSSYIYKSLMSGRPFAGRIKDFTFRYKWKRSKIRFSDLLKSVQSKCARVIISTPKETKTLFVRDGVTVSSFLKTNFRDIKINGRGEIEMMLGYKSSQTFPVDWSYLSAHELSLKSWLFFWPDGSDINTTLEAGKSYYIYYGAVEEISKSARKLTNHLVVKGVNNKNMVEIANLKPFDRFYLRIKNIRENIFVKEERNFFAKRWGLKRVCAKSIRKCVSRRRVCTGWNRSEFNECVGWSTVCNKFVPQCVKYGVERFRVRGCVVRYIDYVSKQRTRFVDQELFKRVMIVNHVGDERRLLDFQGKGEKVVVLKTKRGVKSGMVFEIVMEEKLKEFLQNDIAKIYIKTKRLKKRKGGYVTDDCGNNHLDFSKKSMFFNVDERVTFDCSWQRFSIVSSNML